MKKQLLLLVLILSISCNQKAGKEPTVIENIKIEPFKITIIDYDYSSAYRFHYLITENELKVIFKSEVEGERDSTLFKMLLKPTIELVKLSKIAIDSLDDYYVNPCIKDGSQIRINLIKENKSKTTHLSNYYHPQIGPIIDLANGLVPEPFKIYYNKEELVRDLNDCKY